MKTDKQINIFVVEDEMIIALEIQSTLELLGYNVIGHTQNGDKALDLLATLDIDLVLLDIQIKGTLNGIDLANIINKKYDFPYIFLTSFSDHLTLEMVKDAKPYGYIVKPFTDNDLKVNIELALYNYASNNVDKNCKEIIQNKLSVSLTDRDYDVLMAFRDGLTYKEAGNKLNLSVNTIKTYQKRLFQTLAVSSKHELNQKLRNL